MAKKSSAAVSTEDYERDGVTYTIRVYPEAGSYYAKWVCQCGEDGQSSGTSPTIKLAVIAAQVNTGGHHFSKHKGGSSD